MDVKKWEMISYIICGLLVGIGAIFYVAAHDDCSAWIWRSTVPITEGDQRECVIRWNIHGRRTCFDRSGTVIGVCIIALLQEGILALGFTKDYQLIITGVIVIAAVFSDVVARRRKN